MAGVGHEDAAVSFDPLRPKLMRVAYRMLGAVADAEDVIQEAFIRWMKAERDEEIRHERATGKAPRREAAAESFTKRRHPSINSRAACFQLDFGPYFAGSGRAFPAGLPK